MCGVGAAAPTGLNTARIRKLPAWPYVEMGARATMVTQIPTALETEGQGPEACGQGQGLKGALELALCLGTTLMSLSLQFLLWPNRELTSITWGGKVFDLAVLQVWLAEPSRSMMSKPLRRHLPCSQVDFHTDGTESVW